MENRIENGSRTGSKNGTGNEKGTEKGSRNGNRNGNGYETGTEKGSRTSETKIKANNETSKEAIIEGIDIVRTFKMGEVEVRALRGVSVKIRRGEFVAIMGPSGSGKTTLLNQLGILDTPNSGKVIIDGTETSALSEKEKGKFRLHNLGYVFQDYALLPELSAAENVYLSLMMQGKSKEEYESSAAEILTAVGLGDRLAQLPSKMSGGQQQRVSVARALAHSPIILFADEPCANLDSDTSTEVLDLFKKFNNEYGQTIVMVTHEGWHAEYADRVVRLKDGVVVEEGER